MQTPAQKPSRLSAKSLVNVFTVMMNTPLVDNDIECALHPVVPMQTFSTSSGPSVDFPSQFSTNVFTETQQTVERVLVYEHIIDYLVRQKLDTLFMITTFALTHDITFQNLS